MQYFQLCWDSLIRWTQAAPEEWPKASQNIAISLLPRQLQPQSLHVQHLCTKLWYFSVLSHSEKPLSRSSKTAHDLWANVFLSSHHDPTLTEVQPKCDSLGIFSFLFPARRFKGNRKPVQRLREDGSLGWLFCRRAINWFCQLNHVICGWETNWNYIDISTGTDIIKKKACMYPL